MSDDDARRYNQQAWDQQVEDGNEWTLPVSTEEINRAREGDWSVVLTPNIPVPREWFPPDMSGVRILALASGGGQQGPIFSAVGADVTVFDASEKQLERDQMVAERDGFEIDTVQGDMADLSAFPDETFDLVFHPVSNCFSPVVLPVWREVARVLAPDGLLLAGFTNPVALLVDPDAAEEGVTTLKYAMPFSEPDDLSEEEKKRYTEKNEPLVYAHSLEDQIGGQLAAGLSLTHMFEDYGRDKKDAIDKHLPTHIATRAIKIDLGPFPDEEE
ncbi:MAG: class I SAM-dependent methyltransferase [Deltaproteobacteria bacterium]|jgi:SAM-dependent methyltransferase